MNLKIKDIVMVGIIAIVTLPVLYFAMLFVTGNARIEFAQKMPGATEDRKKLEFLKHSSHQDSLIAIHSQAFLASEKEKVEVEKEQERLAKQQERINILTQELEATRKEQATEREKFEKLVTQVDDLEMKRVKDLAKIYGSMRANEAAQVLETLDDSMLIKIINAIGDDRQKAKIMAALSKSKAEKITKKMGKIEKR